LHYDREAVKAQTGNGTKTPLITKTILPCEKPILSSPVPPYESRYVIEPQHEQMLHVFPSHGHFRAVYGHAMHTGCAVWVDANRSGEFQMAAMR
jgi:hypothetical protein